MRRRTFLKGILAGSALMALRPPLVRASTPYQVGVGTSSTSDPYAATQSAITASGQFPGASMAGQTVVVKPNLVVAEPASSGATTDPQVVRAVVDAALAANAASVLIVEAGTWTKGPPFQACGYGFFATYDPRVQLVDLGTQPFSLVAVPQGLTYQSLYLPTPVLGANVVFISVAKLKTHVDAVATLSMKNLVGLASRSRYKAPPSTLPRWDLHAHGIDESIVDLNLARPVNFAVIDGIWGMEGEGPIYGTPVLMNLVVAGLNPVATDRVALDIMEIPQNAVPHLTYAAKKGLGPADTSGVTVLGDPYAPYPFAPAITPPVVWRPNANPNVISLSAGQQTTISYTIPQACSTLVEIIQDSNVTPGVTTVRTLQNWTAQPAGTATIQWDGTDSSGAPVTPGSYIVRVQAQYSGRNAINYATNGVTVIS